MIIMFMGFCNREEEKRTFWEIKKSNAGVPRFQQDPEWASIIPLDFTRVKQAGRVHGGYDHSAQRA